MIIFMIILINAVLNSSLGNSSFNVPLKKFSANINVNKILVLLLISDCLKATNNFKYVTNKIRKVQQSLNQVGQGCES